MRPRLLIFTILAAIAAGFPSFAAETKKAPAHGPRTWKTVADRVQANGAERTLKAPLTRDLGFDSDAVATKALRYRPEDAPDKKSHAFYVISAPGKDGKPAPKEFILGKGAARDKNGVSYVEDLFLRADMNGKIIAAAKSDGPAGHAAEKKLPPGSSAAVSAFNAERKLHLRTMDLSKLSK